MSLEAKASEHEPAEAEALAALQRNDLREALTILMRAYGTGVYRFCLEQIGSAEAAEDLLQNVFIQAFQSLPRYEPRSTLRAWLYAIARHRCLDVLRRSRRWARLVEATAELPEAADPTPGGEVQLGAADFRAALEECLQQLPPRTRETLLLRFRAQLSYDEIAAASGEQVGTLRVRVARALPLLRICLEQKEVSP